MTTESLEETIIYSKAKLHKKKIEKKIKRNLKTSKSLKKKAAVLQQLSYMGIVGRFKVLMKSKGYQLGLLVLIPFLLFWWDFGDQLRTFFQSNLLYLIFFTAWSIIFMIIGLTIFLTTITIVKYVSYLFSNEYLVKDLQYLAVTIKENEIETGQLASELRKIENIYNKER